MTRLRPLLAALALAGAAAAAPAAPYSSLIVFGDSLSDPGNAAALTPGAGGPFFPPPPYAGTFSNGPTAAQYLAAAYGAPVVGGWPDAAGATNFAVGGARTGSGNYNVLVDSPAGLGARYPALGDTGIAQQIARYAASRDPAAFDPARTLFLLWGGPNDIFYGLALQRAGVPVDFGAVVRDAVGNLSSDIAALASLGARNILVPGLPDLGLTPGFLVAGAASSAFATGLSDAFNATLDAAIDAARASLAPSGVQLREFDTAQYLRDIAASPPAGLANVAGACIADTAALAAGCPGYLFFDDVHPTTQAYALLARQFELAAALPEPATLALLAAGVVLLGTRRRGRAPLPARGGAHRLPVPPADPPPVA